MKTLRFEGHSDDTFGEYETFRDDHDNCASGVPIVWKVTDGDGNGLFVWGLYSPADHPSFSPACWVIGVQQLDEDVEIPDWPMRFEMADRGYSPSFIIEAPDEVAMELAR